MEGFLKHRMLDTYGVVPFFIANTRYLIVKVALICIFC